MGLLSLASFVALLFGLPLLVLGILPVWETLRRRPGVLAALRGANAAVVGLLVAALYQPVWTSAIHTPADFALALVFLASLVLWKLPLHRLHASKGASEPNPYLFLSSS